MCAGRQLAAAGLEERQACGVSASGCGEEEPAPAPSPAAMVAEMLAARPGHLRAVRCDAGSTHFCNGPAASPEFVDVCDSQGGGPSPVAAPQALPRKRSHAEVSPDGVCCDAAEPPAKLRSEAP